MSIFYKLINQAQITSHKIGFGIILIAFLLGCKETIIILTPPSVSILSVSKVSLSSFEITIDYKPGEGQEITDSRIELENLTIYDSPIIIEKLNLGGNEPFSYPHSMQVI